MMKYEQIDHTGDIAIRIYGASLEKLFENAAFALFDLVTDIDQIQLIEQRELIVEGSDPQVLLVNWLSELNFLFQTEYLLVSEFKITELSEHKIRALISGERRDAERHRIFYEIKAVTFHGLKLEQSPSGDWVGEIVFDI